MERKYQRLTEKELDVFIDKRIHQLREEGAKEDSTEGLSQKEINRRKLAAARRRDAERYGDEYVDATDDDIK